MKLLVVCCSTSRSICRCVDTNNFLEVFQDPYTRFFVTPYQAEFDIDEIRKRAYSSSEWWRVLDTEASPVVYSTLTSTFPVPEAPVEVKPEAPQPVVAETTPPNPRAIRIPDHIRAAALAHQRRNKQ